MTPEQKRKRFFQKMARGSKDAEDDYAWGCFMIEKEMGQVITPDYPVSKFLVQLEYLKRYYEEQKREMSKGKSSGKVSTFR